MKVIFFKVFSLYLLISVLLFSNCNLLVDFFNDLPDPLPVNQDPTAAPLEAEPTAEPTAAPPTEEPAIDVDISVFFVPNEDTVILADEFYIDLHVQTGDIAVNRFNFLINYDDSFLEVISSLGDDGVETVTDNFIINNINSSAAGKIGINGNDDPAAANHDMYIFRIFLRAIGTGSSTVTVTIRDFQTGELYYPDETSIEECSVEVEE